MENKKEKKITKLLLFKELLDKQIKFIKKHELDDFEDEDHFNNFISNDDSLLREKPLLRDEDGFIDFKKYEENEEL